MPLHHRQKFLSNGTLQIEHVDAAYDGGQYTCIASNEKGEKAEASFYVKVKGMDIFGFINIFEIIY